MQSASFPSRQARGHYRHELRTLTYVILDEANGGVIRNLNHEGVAVQAVGALRAQQRVRLRFELRSPRLRLDTYGQVSWASPSGQCGIRFVSLGADTRHQINQWIFSNLLDTVARQATHSRSIFGDSIFVTDRQEQATEEIDGLTLSPRPRAAIRLEPVVISKNEEPALPQPEEDDSVERAFEANAQLSWLSRPISTRTIAWLVDGLVVTAALLMFAVIFLSIAHELPQRPLTLGASLAAAVFVAAAYWTLFAIFGGPSLGTRLAQAATGFEEKKDGDGREDRFR
ncbi:MAG: PilZ domain-containing protein [Candidatus Sulfotelmatobacter sp.]|jgi:hypothetical protein